jgi:hypothetical protein
MRRNYIFIILLSTTFIAIIAHLYFNQPTYEISSQNACENAKTGKYDYIVDVRTKQEWNEGHLENTLSIPIGNLVNELPDSC